MGRIVIVPEEDGAGRAWRGTAPGARVAALVPVARERGGIEPNFPDLKEVEGIEPGPWRRVGSNGGAWHRTGWVPPRIAVGAWGRSAASLSDRWARPGEAAARRPSPADRRRVVQRLMLEADSQRIGGPQPWSVKIRPLLAGVVRRAA